MSKMTRRDFISRAAGFALSYEVSRLLPAALSVSNRADVLPDVAVAVGKNEHSVEKILETAKPVESSPTPTVLPFTSTPTVPPPTATPLPTATRMAEQGAITPEPPELKAEQQGSDVVNAGAFLSGALIPAAAVVAGLSMVMMRRMRSAQVKKEVEKPEEKDAEPKV